MVSTIEKFIENLQGAWQEIECKITSVAEWQALEQPVSKIFANHNNAELAITEIVLNALTATAGLNGDLKTAAMQNGTFADLVKNNLENPNNLENNKFVKLKLSRTENNNIQVSVFDMGGPSDFDIQKYLELLNQKNKDQPKKNIQHGRGLMLVSSLAENNNLKSSDYLDQSGVIIGKKVEFAMQSVVLETKLESKSKLSEDLFATKPAITFSRTASVKPASPKPGSDSMKN